MRNARIWLGATLFTAVLACAMLTMSEPTPAAADPKGAAGNHWRHHDGHWNYWHEGDQRWYYTDGSNWFYNNTEDNAWNVYGFDKQFGRDGFERGEYKVPAREAKIESPRHGIYRPARK